MTVTANKKFSLEAYVVPISIFVVIAGSIISFVTNQRIAQLIGSEAFGDYYVSVSALILLGSISLLGLDFIVSRQLPLHLEKNKYKTGAQFVLRLVNYLKPLMLSIFVCGVILLPILMFSGKEFKTLRIFEQAHPFFYFIWAVPLVAGYGYLMKVLYSTRLKLLGIVVSKLMFPVVQFALFFALARNIPHHFAAKFLLAPILATAFLALIMGVILFVFFRSRMKTEPLFAPIVPAKNDVGKLIPAGLMLLISTFIISQNGSLIVIIMDIVARNQNEVGHLSVCFSCFNVFFYTIFTALIGIVLPKFAVFMAKKDQLGLQRFLTRMNLMAGVLASFMVAVICYFAKEIVAGFGADFAGNQQVIEMLRVGAVSILPVFFTYYTYCCLASKKENAAVTLKLSLFFIGFIIALSIPLVYFFNGPGGMASFIAAEIVYNTACALVLFRRTGIKPLAF